MRETTVCSILALAASVSPAWADTYPRQSAVDAIHYVFRLTLSEGSAEIRGEATVTVRFVTDRANEVWLDLTSPANGKGMTVSAVTNGDQKLWFTHQNNRLRIALPSLPMVGAEQSFTIEYEGTPAEGLRLIPNIHGEQTIFSESWPNKARQWLPTIDHPYDKATGELIVTAPASYQVIANGLLVEERDLQNGLRVSHWKQSAPIASWLFAVGVARFAVHHAGLVKGVPLQSWVFPQDRDTGFTLFEETSRRAMEFFTEHIGPYSYEKLANVQAADLNGGVEYATTIFYGEKGVATGRGPVVHEVAHQWWGNAVTERDWDDVWLSEGFATYFTLLYTEHFDGRDAFVAGLKSSRDRVLELEQKLPDTPVIHRNLADMKQVLNQFVYQKGGWALHMLRSQLGTETFWDGIREYYRRYQNQNASSDELRQVMEQVSGQKLSWFFEQWLTRSGVPKLTGWWRYDSTKKVVEIELTQAQDGPPYRLPLEVGVTLQGSSTVQIEHVELTGESGRFTLMAEVPPTSVVLDPNTWVLMELPDFEKR